MNLSQALRPLFTWATFFGLLPIVIAILCSGYITYRYNLAVTEIRSQVQGSLVLTTAIDDVLIDLQDLETGQRGYIITGDEAYLEPFDAARERFKADMNTLLSQVAAQTDYTASVESISELADQKLQELDRTISVRRGQGFQAAQAIVRGNEGKSTMDEIRSKVSAMREAEANRLAQQTREMQQAENRVVLIVAITVGLGIVGRLIGLALPAWWRSRSKRHRPDNA